MSLGLLLFTVYVLYINLRMFCERRQTALRKVANRALKGRLLESKRRSFANPLIINLFRVDNDQKGEKTILIVKKIW